MSLCLGIHVPDRHVLRGQIVYASSRYALLWSFRARQRKSHKREKSRRRDSFSTVQFFEAPGTVPGGFRLSIPVCNTTHMPLSYVFFTIGQSALPRGDRCGRMWRSFLTWGWGFFEAPAGCTTGSVSDTERRLHQALRDFTSRGIHPNRHHRHVLFTAD